MYSEWEKDLKWSSKTFENLVWPILRKDSRFKNSKLILVEQITKSDFAKDLDRTAEIDLWEVSNSKGIRGIASRMQVIKHPFKPYNTFTIRKSRETGSETQYSKLQRFINSEEGWIYPALNIQGYVTDKENGNLLSFALAYTKDILHKIEKGECFIKNTFNAEFYCVYWGDYCLLIWESSSESLFDKPE